jgi:hypothetical protein
MKRILAIICIGLIALLMLGACQSMHNFYIDNREIIQDIITIILDTVFDELGQPSLDAPAGDNSVKKIQSVIPYLKVPNNDTYYKAAISRIVNSPAFWETVDAKVEDLFKEKGVR